MVRGRAGLTSTSNLAASGEASQARILAAPWTSSLSSLVLFLYSPVFLSLCCIRVVLFFISHLQSSHALARVLLLLPLLLGSALCVLLAEEGRSRPLLSWRSLHVLVLRAIGTGTDRAGHATFPVGRSPE